MIGGAIAALAVVVALLTVLLIARVDRRAAAIAAVVILVIMVGEHLLASRGILREWMRRPPPMMLGVAVPVLLALVTAASSLGHRIATTASFAAIIGIQAFRFPLELVMHQAAISGLMPPQMSYSGRNFDIITGILAIPVAWIAARSTRSRLLIMMWNAIGTLLLINIVTIAVASMPMFAAFGPARLNTWIADSPYVFLPAILVPAAVFGHALIWRKLLGAGGG